MKKLLWKIRFSYHLKHYIPIEWRDAFDVAEDSYDIDPMQSPYDAVQEEISYFSDEG